jgi:hypothetical protein
MQPEVASKRGQPPDGHGLHAPEGAPWCDNESTLFERICGLFHLAQPLLSRRMLVCPRYAGGALRKHAKLLG